MEDCLKLAADSLSFLLNGGGRLTKQDSSSTTDILRGTECLSRHNGRLETKPHAKADEELVSDPLRGARVRAPGVEETAADGVHDGADEDEGGEVADFGYEYAGEDDGEGWGCGGQ